MTQDEIIEMANQAGFELDDSLAFEPEVVWYIGQRQLETFASLVAQHERERIKKANAPEIERVNAHIKQLEDAVLAEREACIDIVAMFGGSIEIEAAIRARGQA